MPWHAEDGPPAESQRHLRLCFSQVVAPTDNQCKPYACTALTVLTFAAEPARSGRGGAAARASLRECGQCGGRTKGPTGGEALTTVQHSSHVRTQSGMHNVFM